MGREVSDRARDEADDKDGEERPAVCDTAPWVGSFVHTVADLEDELEHHPALDEAKISLHRGGLQQADELPLEAAPPEEDQVVQALENLDQRQHVEEQQWLDAVLTLAHDDLPEVVGSEAQEQAEAQGRRVLESCEPGDLTRAKLASSLKNVEVRKHCHFYLNN